MLHIIEKNIKKFCSMYTYPSVVSFYINDNSVLNILSTICKTAAWRLYWLIHKPKFKHETRIYASFLFYTRRYLDGITLGLMVSSMWGLLPLTHKKSRIFCYLPMAVQARPMTTPAGVSLYMRSWLNFGFPTNDSKLSMLTSTDSASPLAML